MAEDKYLHLVHLVLALLVSSNLEMLASLRRQDSSQYLSLVYLAASRII